MWLRIVALLRTGWYSQRNNVVRRVQPVFALIAPRGIRSYRQCRLISDTVLVDAV